MTKGESSITLTTLANVDWLLNAKVGDKVVMCRYCRSTVTVKKGCYRLHKHAKTLRHKRNEELAENAVEGHHVEFEVEKRNQKNIEEDVRRINEASARLKRLHEASASLKKMNEAGSRSVKRFKGGNLPSIESSIRDNLPFKGGELPSISRDMPSIPRDMPSLARDMPSVSRVMIDDGPAADLALINSIY